MQLRFRSLSLSRTAGLLILTGLFVGSQVICAAQLQASSNRLCRKGANRTSRRCCPQQFASPVSASVSPVAQAVVEPKPPTAAPAEKTEIQWESLFDGKTMDGWKPTEFGTGGEILVEKGNMVISFGDGCTGVTWQKDFPKVDYEVRLEAQRVDGTDFFCGMTFPVQESPCSFIVGGWGGGVVGLSSIDGEDAARNKTTQYMEFKKGQWYKIRLRVTKTRISAWIDEKQVIDQETTGHKLTIRPEVEKSRPFGICSWSTTAALRKIELRKLTAEESQPVKDAEPKKE